MIKLQKQQQNIKTKMKMYKNKILGKTTIVSQYWSQLYDRDFLNNYPSQNNSIYIFHILCIITKSCMYLFSHISINGYFNIHLILIKILIFVSSAFIYIYNFLDKIALAIITHNTSLFSIDLFLNSTT